MKKFFGISAFLAFVGVMAIVSMNLSDWVMFWTPHKVRDISSEVFQGGFALLLWKYLARKSLRYLKFPSFNLLNLIFLLPAINQIFWAFDSEFYKTSSSKHLFYSILVVIGIGFGEEMLCRGFAYGYLSRFGIFVGVMGSSIFFGMMHITNAIFGQSISSTFAQIINASGMGVLACGLMLAMKSIWPAVVMHAINDLPMTVLEVKKMTFGVTPMEILGTTAWALIPVIFGLLLTLAALIRDTELRSGATKFDLRVLNLLGGFGGRIERWVSGSKIFGHLVQPTQMK